MEQLQLIENYKDCKTSRYNLFQEKEDGFYIVNALSKGIVKIENDEVNFIRNILEIKEEVTRDSRFPGYYDILINNGFLIKKEMDELKSQEYNYSRYHFSDRFISMTLLPTLLCNFKCPYCFEKVKDISWDDARLETMKLFAKKNFRFREAVQISIFGGEPLLQWKRLKLFLDYVLELKAEYGFNLYLTGATNAYLLSQEVIDDLFDKYCCTSLQITIDGNKESHNQTRKLKNGEGTYDVILNNVRRTLRKIHGTDKKVALRVNLLNDVVEGVKTLLQEFNDEEKKAMVLYFRPVFDSEIYTVQNCNRDNLEEFYKLGKSMGFTFIDSYMDKLYYCEGDSGLNTMEINPDLTVWKCMSDADHKPARLGYISADGEIVYDNTKLQNWSDKNPFLDENCRKCLYLPFCYGGCPLEYSKNKNRTCFYERNFDLVELLTRR